MMRALRTSHGRTSGVLTLWPLVLALVLAAFANGAHAQETAGIDVRARLERALTDYEQAEREADRDARIAGFRRAERGFAALLADGFATPALHTNLGSAALQAGDLGQAVLAYRRALRLDPAAVTARQNLAHVRSLLPAWVPRPSGSEGADALLVYRRIPASTRSLLAACGFALAALFLVVAARRPEGPWRGLAILFGIVWLLLLASVVLDGSGEEGVAVVLTSDEEPARSSDSALARLAFPDPLPQGVEALRLETRGDFARIRLANGRDVWVRNGSLTPVAD
ncbi:MAG: tetratricopeptide repeat protein [Myxococcota bacterium]